LDLKKEKFFGPKEKKSPHTPMVMPVLRQKVKCAYWLSLLKLKLLLVVVLKCRPIRAQIMGSHVHSNTVQVHDMIPSSDWLNEAPVCPTMIQ